MTATTTLEAALAQMEKSITDVLKVATGVTRELRRARNAAAVGTLRELRRALGEAEGMAGNLKEEIRQLLEGWGFDEQGYLASDGYLSELEATARLQGVRLVKRDLSLVGFPLIIRVRPAELALEMNRRLDRRIRPSVVVRRLRDLQAKPPRFASQRFLESLFRAYGYVVKERGRNLGATARLIDVYKVLTLLPGMTREYTQAEFSRDIYLLDESGVRRTRDGYRVRFPAAAGIRTAATLSSVTKAGDLKVYYGVAFEKSEKG
jgi:hypothetical protein